MMNEKIKCELCKTNITSKNYERHLKTEKHKRAITKNRFKIITNKKKSNILI